MPSDAELLALSQDLSATASEAARLVADDLRTAFRAGMDVEFKRDKHDPVTVHDRRAEETISALLTERFPGSTIVGEEDGEHQGRGEITWYVDPIDGTANFARGLSFFCTSIGAVLDGRIVAGAILDPMAGNLFTADLTGAWLNASPLRSSGPREEAEATILTSYPSARDIAADGAEGLASFGELVSAYGTLRRPGSSALSLAHVAAGWVDATVGFSNNAWDICAGELLVQQAGASYLAFGGEPGWNQPNYAAYSPDLEPTALNRFLTDLQK
ncbi:inositol monophosphatase family protein [Kribbella sp. CA-293567]|uniref:inositol monophosphatase family protein n=1 Tax=Kribbella sp. CA-293567 TaxID=3002436 RepID=UPI0022DDAF4E|nr:inositol monophosphatase family protein [Kribbella sp. CA-293567]WBQ03666.1 inositol monophosphatase family protein [Kribbella sp. CA-293567]